jgi:integrative and conjugative element protein (TIGR02256 family)
MGCSDASIAVWRVDSDWSVRRVPVEVRRVLEIALDQWTVVLDEGLRERLGEFREAKLPNETGGVLVGSFDLERKILYVVDSLPSPPDSEEKRDLYIRGCKGLRDAVAEVEEKTGGMLEYIGEWHSHPRGATTSPSDYDLAAFHWLTMLMSKDGLPAVMAIVGDLNEARVFVGSMRSDAAATTENSRGRLLA